MRAALLFLLHAQLSGGSPFRSLYGRSRLLLAQSGASRFGLVLESLLDMHHAVSGVLWCMLLLAYRRAVDGKLAFARMKLNADRSSAEARLPLDDVQQPAFSAGSFG